MSTFSYNAYYSYQIFSILKQHDMIFLLSLLLYIFHRISPYLIIESEAFVKRDSHGSLPSAKDRL